MKNQKFDIYIEKSPDFAQEILIEIRNRVHQSHPEIQEEIKWGFPNFTLNGKILCSMAAFKKHCNFGFWLAPLMTSIPKNQKMMNDFGQLKSLSDLPPSEEFEFCMQEAIKLSLEGKTIDKTKTRKELIEAEDLLISLAKEQNAFTFYQQLAPSHKLEYNDWILEAKTEVTKNKRIVKTIELLKEGKSRNWKYES
jgi:uncharacterized protein YdhG (YjbR/CyaY superfamily)